MTNDLQKQSPAQNTGDTDRIMNSPSPSDASRQFSVIVPCYNEEGGIEQTVNELMTSLTNSTNYEILIVNDGSTDATASILEGLSQNDGALRVVNHNRNRGYGAALKTGIRQANSELIVITDADGTYPNDRIPELVEAMREADMVIGARIADNVHYPLIRKIPKLFLRKYAEWIAGQDIPDINSGLRVFRRSIADRFLNILPNGFSFTTTITLAMLTNSYPVQFVPIGYSRRIGKSKIRPIRDTINFFQLIMRTGMYFAPLRIFAPLLFVMAAAFLTSLWYDVFILNDLTEKTLLLLILLLNGGMFALLADMIDKRT